MNQSLVDVITELYEMRNTLGYLKRQFGYQQRSPMLLSSIPNCLRVVVALQQRSADFFKIHDDLAMQALTYNVAIIEILEAFDRLSKNYDLESDGILTSLQKDTLCQSLGQIDKCFLKAAGLLYHKAVAHNVFNDLEDEVKEFLTEAREVFDKESEMTDIIEDLMTKHGIDDPDDAEELIAKNSTDAGIDELLAAQKSAKGKNDTSKKGTKQIISPKIDE